MLDVDGDVDLLDALAMQNCFGSTDGACGSVDLGPGGSSPVTGDFGLHGRWIDVLPDGHVLMDYRAREYNTREVTFRVRIERRQLEQMRVGGSRMVARTLEGQEVFAARRERGWGI